MGGFADRAGKEYNRGMKQVALYARVSTGGQTVENQLRDLRAAVVRRTDWQVVE